MTTINKVGLLGQITPQTVDLQKIGQSRLTGIRHKLPTISEFEEKLREGYEGKNPGIESER